MLRTLTLALALSAAGLALTAPASANDRIRLININGYSVVDDQHVILTGGASRYYLVTLRRRCSGLRFGSAIGTSFDSNATIMNPRFEYIQAELGQGLRCYIETIEQVESRDAARALIDERAEAAESGDDGMEHIADEY